MLNSTMESENSERVFGAVALAPTRISQGVVLDLVSLSFGAGKGAILYPQQPLCSLLSHSCCKAWAMVRSLPHLPPPHFFCFRACATSDRPCLVLDSWCMSGGLIHFHHGSFCCETDNNCGHHLEPLVCVFLCCGFYGSGCCPFEPVPLTALACWRPHNLQ